MPKDMLVGNMDFRRKSIKNLSYPFRIIYSIEARKKIGVLIKEFKPHIVHLNNYNFQITPSIIYEIKKYRIPIVQTLHDYAILCPAHTLYNSRKGEVCEKCKGYKYVNCIRLKCIHNSLMKSIIGAMEGYLYHWKKTYDYISTFICPSGFIAAKVAQFGIAPHKLKVLHNFTTGNEFDGGYKKQDYVLYFGRISEEKGIRSLLKAVSELKHIRFVFAGSGPMDMDIKGYDNIIYVGFKTGQELKILIKESLFTVYPSEYYDNCPMSILESQTLGTPVIASNIGGIPELVKDNYSGLLFEAGNTKDLTVKIDTLYQNRELINLFSERCREIINMYSKEAYCDEITNIYNESLAGCGGN
ncbi:glycosyltransferase family 4 protein [Ruminiclostridium josui]|uniref:glycosyltransferase family 4 protein n=1 Tax=Ruminiclostridium josui TaxID=1499 RepID=UPI0004AF1E56|nr:glycosyltransferase family 4 protein [Ruminiclostridium josui]